MIQKIPQLGKDHFRKVRPVAPWSNPVLAPLIEERRVLLTTIILRGSVKCFKWVEMKRLRDAKAWQNAFACLLTAHLLIVVALAASPQLHQLLHHDADRSNHECAVTMMVSGGSDGSSVPQVLEPSVILPVVFDFLLETHLRDVAPLFLSAHIFEHAPPLI